MSAEDEPENRMIRVVSCPLGYVEFAIKGKQHWGMVDSGSMVNIFPGEIAVEAGLVMRQSLVGL